jgi:hypothetical protein
MIDPHLVADAFKKTTTVLPVPIPTVVPDVPRFEKIGDAGIKTLWVSWELIQVTQLTSLGRLRCHGPLHSRPRLPSMANSSRTSLSPHRLLIAAGQCMLLCNGWRAPDRGVHINDAPRAVRLQRSL